jgi:hypothetical protein
MGTTRKSLKPACHTMNNVGTMLRFVKLHCLGKPAQIHGLRCIAMTGSPDLLANLCLE